MALAAKGKVTLPPGCITRLVGRLRQITREAANGQICDVVNVSDSDSFA